MIIYIKLTILASIDYIRRLFKRFAPHYFSQPLTKIEKCSFEGLKSDVSPARTPSFDSFQQIAEL
jgi:hypothetical protein